jgi:hypothetical protein
MRNNRAPREDRIVAELIKCRGEGVVDVFHEPIKLKWTTENMPQEWNRGVICPLHNKGDKSECNNYRGVTVLNNAYKIFSSILNERLKISTDRIM